MSQENNDTAQAAATAKPQPKHARPRVAAQDLDFVADAKAAFLEEKSPLTNLMLLAVVGVVAVFIVWASQSTLDETTKAQGKIVPSASLQVVQSLEGGILASMAVSEGDIVARDQPLLQIDDTAFAATLRESVVQRHSLLASLARLDAESRDETALAFPESIVLERPDLVASETELFEARRQNLATTLSRLSRTLELKRSELAITRPLAEKGVVSQIELLRLEAAANDVQGEIERARSDYMKDVLTRRNDARAQLEQIEQSVLAYQDKVRRATLRSPAQGVVNKVHFKTLGGVIRPGEPILEIVPGESALLVEANVKPGDIGFIHPGQGAMVKLTAYDFSIYGGLRGTVERISADTFADERGESFYKILVRAGERSLKTTGEELAIIPGMQVEVDILTGEKTVLDYIFKPLLRARMNALSER